MLKKYKIKKFALSPDTIITLSIPGTLGTLVTLVTLGTLGTLGTSFT